VVGGQVGGGGHKSPPSLAIQVGGCELPPTRVSSKGGVVVGGQVGGGGHKSPPSLVIQVEGWLLARKPSNSRFERGRWWAQIPSVTQIASGGGGAWQKPRQLALQARERVGMCRVCVSAVVVKKEHNEEGITPSLCRNL